MKHTAKTAPAPAPAPRKAAAPAPAPAPAPDAPAPATPAPAARLADASAALAAAAPAPAAPRGGVSDSLQKTVNEIARYYPAAILAAAATIDGQHAPAPAPATASPAPATRCPDAGNVVLSESTLEGIEHFANEMENGIHCRLKQYLRAAVFAGQCADDESGLAAVRVMFEYLLADLADDFCRCCNLTLERHLDGRDIFADCSIGDNMIL